MKNENWLWPLKGGTWNERWLAVLYGLELAALCVAWNFLFWTLGLYF